MLESKRPSGQIPRGNQQREDQTSRGVKHPPNDEVRVPRALFDEEPDVCRWREHSQRELSWHGQAPPAAPYDMPPGGVPPGLAGARGAPSSSRCPALDDDEAVAQALQDEYDREHSNLRQHATRSVF